MKFSKNYIERSSPLINLNEAACALGVSPPKLRRLIHRLQIKIYRSGWTVLLNRNTLPRLRKGLDRGVLRVGRPKKEARGLGAPRK